MNWIALTTPIELDHTQVDTFAALIHGNSRPPQPMNGRVVVAGLVH